MLIVIELHKIINRKFNNFVNKLLLIYFFISIVVYKARQVFIFVYDKHEFI